MMFLKSNRQRWVMNEQLTCTQNSTYCGSSAQCYLSSKSITISFTPNTSSFDCKDKAGDGFYIVPNSYTTQSYSGSLPDEHSWCHWYSDAVKVTGTTYDVNGLYYKIDATQHWHSDGQDWGVSCSWVQDKPAVISAVSCTNDTATFVSQ